jgi:hypothetical protein
LLSLSVHGVMLDVLGIPHPDNTHVGAAAMWLDQALSVTATIVFTGLHEATSVRFRWCGGDFCSP